MVVCGTKIKKRKEQSFRYKSNKVNWNYYASAFSVLQER